MATAKKATKKKETPTVSFTDDIPTITREHSGTRKGKYDELLDNVKEAGEKDPKKRTAYLTLEKQNQATSRYLSLKNAVEKREDATHWMIAQRSVGEDEYRVYIQWSDKESAPESKSK